MFTKTFWHICYIKTLRRIKIQSYTVHIMKHKIIRKHEWRWRTHNSSVGLYTVSQKMHQLRNCIARIITIDFDDIWQKYSRRLWNRVCMFQFSCRFAFLINFSRNDKLIQKTRRTNSVDLTGGFHGTVYEAITYGRCCKQEHHHTSQGMSTEVIWHYTGENSTCISKTVSYQPLKVTVYRYETPLHQTLQVTIDRHDTALQCSTVLMSSTHRYISAQIISIRHRDKRMKWQVKFVSHVIIVCTSFPCVHSLFSVGRVAWFGE